MKLFSPIALVASFASMTIGVLPSLQALAEQPKTGIEQFPAEPSTTIPSNQIPRYSMPIETLPEYKIPGQIDTGGTYIAPVRIVEITPGGAPGRWRDSNGRFTSRNNPFGSAPRRLYE